MTFGSSDNMYLRHEQMERNILVGRLTDQVYTEKEKARIWELELIN